MNRTITAALTAALTLSPAAAYTTDTPTLTGTWSNRCTTIGVTSSGQPDGTFVKVRWYGTGATNEQSELVPTNTTWTRDVDRATVRGFSFRLVDATGKPLTPFEESASSCIAIGPAPTPTPTETPTTPAVTVIPVPTLVPDVTTCGPDNDTAKVDPKWLEQWGAIVDGPWIDPVYRDGVVRGSTNIKADQRAAYVWASWNGKPGDWTSWRVYPGTEPLTYRDANTPCETPTPDPSTPTAPPTSEAPTTPPVTTTPPAPTTSTTPPAPPGTVPTAPPAVTPPVTPTPTVPPAPAPHRPKITTRLVQIDTYRVTSTREARTVRAYAADGRLTYREDKAQWRDSTWTIARQTLTDGKVTRTTVLTRGGNGTKAKGQTITMTWTLGKGATVRHPWGPRFNIPQTVTR